DEGDGGSSTPPSTTQVTISTDSSTQLYVDHQQATVSNLAAGQEFRALFSGSPSDDIQTLVSNPALFVFARAPHVEHELYAFVGTVTAVDPTAGTVTVDVIRSRPGDLAPPGSSATFTVDSNTLVLGGSSSDSLFGGSLSDVNVGDLFAGGVAGPAAQTL